MEIKRLWNKWTHDVPEGHEYFSGNYHGGDASYTYVEQDGERLFDGPFKFYRQLDQDMYDKASGHFTMNRKTGDWQFAHRGFRHDLRLDVQFSNGHIDGELSLVDVEDKVSFSLVNAIEMTVNEDKVKGELSGLINEGDFFGFCDENGFADGQWTLTFKKGKKTTTMATELWEHGVCVKAYEEDYHLHKKNDIAPFMRERLNMILSEDLPKLLKIVKRGTSWAPVHIKRK